MLAQEFLLFLKLAQQVVESDFREQGIQGQRKRQEDQQNPTVQTPGSSQRELRQPKLMLALLEKGFQCPAPPPFSEDG